MNVNMSDKIIKTLFFILFFLGLGVAVDVHAAVFSLKPQTGVYTIGSAFSVSITIDGSEQDVNAAEAELLFDTSELRVVSISKEGSIFAFWPVEPDYSNDTGKIAFAGGRTSPFSGSEGTVLTVTFKAVRDAYAAVVFGSGAILAADGKGTNILTEMRQGTYTLKPKTTIPEIERYLSLPGAPPRLEVRSPTHPDQERWYPATTALFLWQFPSGIINIRTLFDHDEFTVPANVHMPLSEVEVPDIKDGIWYLHVQARNAVDWGGIAHYRVQVDSARPDILELNEIPRSDSADPRAKFNIRAVDKTSGIDFYEMRIDSGELKTWRDDGSHTYAPAFLDLGTHTLTVAAVDMAGLKDTRAVGFEITPLDPPVIAEYPRELSSSDVLVVKGSTYPNATTIFWLQKDKEEPVQQAVRSDDKGNFVFVAADRLQDGGAESRFSFIGSTGMQSGVYSLWAEVHDDRGAKSYPTEKLTFVVRAPTLVRFGTMAIGVLQTLVLFIALLVLLGFMVWYSWHRFVLVRARVTKETREAETTLHKEIWSLREHLKEYLSFVEKERQEHTLSDQEREFMRKLKKGIEETEEHVEKEIEDIEKEMK